MRRQALADDQRWRKAQATADKTARLRALRLARDATDPAPDTDDQADDPGRS